MVGVVRPIRVAGGVAGTAEEVLEAYAPDPELISSGEWAHVRGIAIAATRAAGYEAPSSARQALRYATRMLVWAYRRGQPLDPEAVFTQDNVRAFLATEGAGWSEAGRATAASYLHRLAWHATTRAPWHGLPAPVGRARPIAPPYTAREIAGYWAAAEVQATEARTRVLTTMLTLGLGAGVKAGELLRVTSGDVLIHPQEPRLWVVVLSDRTVPVLIEYVPALARLTEKYPEGPLIGPHNTHARDPVGKLRSSLEIPSYLPPLRQAQLRTTWMVQLLSMDVRITEFMTIAGLSSGSVLEKLLPYVADRDDQDRYLLAGAGLSPRGGPRAS